MAFAWSGVSGDGDTYLTATSLGSAPLGAHGPVTNLADMTGATQDEIDYSGSGNHAVWLHWVAPADGWYQFELSTTATRDPSQDVLTFEAWLDDAAVLFDESRRLGFTGIGFNQPWVDLHAYEGGGYLFRVFLPGPNAAEASRHGFTVSWQKVAGHPWTWYAPRQGDNVVVLDRVAHTATVDSEDALAQARLWWDVGTRYLQSDKLSVYTVDRAWIRGRLVDEGRTLVDDNAVLLNASHYLTDSLQVAGVDPTWANGVAKPNGRKHALRIGAGIGTVATSSSSLYAGQRRVVLTESEAALASPAELVWQQDWGARDDPAYPLDLPEGWDQATWVGRLVPPFTAHDTVPAGPDDYGGATRFRIVLQESDFSDDLCAIVVLTDLQLAGGTPQPEDWAPDPSQWVASVDYTLQAAMKVLAQDTNPNPPVDRYGLPTSEQWEFPDNWWDFDFPWDFDWSWPAHPDPAVTRVWLSGSRALARAEAEVKLPVASPWSTPDYADPWAGEGGDGTTIPEGQGIRTERWARFEVGPYIVVRGQAQARPPLLAVSRSSAGVGWPASFDRPEPAEVDPGLFSRWLPANTSTWVSSGVVRTFQPGVAPGYALLDYALPSGATLTRPAMVFDGDAWMTLEGGSQSALTAVLVARLHPGSRAFYGLLEAVALYDRVEADLRFGLRHRLDTVEVFGPMRMADARLLDLVAGPNTPLLIALSLDPAQRVGRLLVRGRGRMSTSWTLPPGKAAVDTDLLLGRASGSPVPGAMAVMELLEVGLDPRALSFAELDQVSARLDSTYGITG